MFVTTENRAKRSEYQYMKYKCSLSFSPGIKNIFEREGKILIAREEGKVVREKKGRNPHYIMHKQKTFSGAKRMKKSH